jgi:dipeptidase E
MKYLLTSAGIKNSSIHDALVDLLGRPVAEFPRPLHPHCDLPLSGRPFDGLPVHQRVDGQPNV